MIVWHLSHSEAELTFHDPSKAPITARGQTHYSLMSVFMMLAGFAIELLGKGIYLRRRGVTVAGGRFPGALTSHGIGPLLDQLGIELTPAKRVSFGVLRRSCGGRGATQCRSTSGT